MLKRFFELEWELQKLIMKMNRYPSNVVGRIQGGVLLLCVIWTIVAKLLECSRGIMVIPALVLFAVFFGLGFISKSLGALTTASGFFKKGIVNVGIVALIIFEVVWEVDMDFNTHLLQSNEGTFYALVGIHILVWNLYSSLCNAKVATLCNAVLSVAVGIGLELKNLVIGYLSVAQSMGEIKISNDILQQLDFLISFMAFPIFLTLAISTAVCAVKQYWIEKYNKGRDIVEYDEADEKKVKEYIWD